MTETKIAALVLVLALVLSVGAVLLFGVRDEDRTVPAPWETDPPVELDESDL